MSACKLLLTGDAQTELFVPYFRERFSADELVFAAPGEQADIIYDVTAHDKSLADEIPGFFDERMKALAGCPYSLDGIKAIVDEFDWFFATFRGSVPKKVLAVDADNTLWRGILSEDGEAALEPYAEFQAGIKALRNDGVVTVLLSKNDAFEFRVDMPLRNADFAVVKTNWTPKAGNLIEACRELNLGVDSVVFVDDNPYERAQMKAHLPEVGTVGFNGNERQMLRRLREYFFSGAGRTEEDRLRAADYARRRMEMNIPKDREEYLRDLGVWVKPALATEDNLDRLAQMAGKTNQFNATTIRRSREDFEAMLGDGGRRIFVFRSGDRFGEQGLICYIIVDLASRRITDFVMSCRAMGRGIEFSAYEHVAKELGYRPGIDFVPTAKNNPFREFLSALGQKADD